MITNLSVKFILDSDQVGGLKVDGFLCDEQLMDVFELCKKMRQHYSDMGIPFSFKVSYKDEDL